MMPPNRFYPFLIPSRRKISVSGWKMSIKLNLYLDTVEIIRQLTQSWLGNFLSNWIKTGTVRSLNTKNAEWIESTDI